jgi:hypothetical protein
MWHKKLLPKRVLSRFEKQKTAVKKKSIYVNRRWPLFYPVVKNLFLLLRNTGNSCRCHPPGG